MADRLKNQGASHKSLHEQLEENKDNKEIEFYEESKAEKLSCALSDDDAKFLMALEENNRSKELELKSITDAALSNFRIRHEFLVREQQVQTIQAERQETIASISSTKPANSASTLKSKRSLLGIAPKERK